MTCPDPAFTAAKIGTVLSELMFRSASQGLKWIFQLFALVSMVNLSSADYQEEILLGEVANWQIVFWPYTEQGGTCVARATLFSQKQQHSLDLNGVDGLWAWWIYASDPELFARERKAQLKFEFDDGTVYSVIASSHENLVKSESLSIELINSFSESNWVELSLGERQLADISLGNGQELIETLEKCHQERVKAILEILEHESRISELRARGEFQKILDDLAKILRLTEQAYGENHMEVADVLNRISLTYYDLDKPEEGIELQKRRLQIVELKWGPSAPETAREIVTLAFDYLSANRFAEAERYALSAINIAKEVPGIDQRELNTWLNTLAQVYVGQDRLTDADQLLTNELREQEPLLGPEHPALVELINGLADVNSVQGRYAEVETLEERALELLKKTYGEDSMEVSMHYERVAETYFQRGRLAESCALREKAFAIRKTNLGSDSPQLEANALASMLINTAICYEFQAN